MWWGGCVVYFWVSGWSMHEIYVRSLNDPLRFVKLNEAHDVWVDVWSFVTIKVEPTTI